MGTNSISVLEQDSDDVLFEKLDRLIGGNPSAAILSILERRQLKALTEQIKQLTESSERLEKLTKTLKVLTIVLIVLTVAPIVMEIWKSLHTHVSIAASTEQTSPD